MQYLIVRVKRVLTTLAVVLLIAGLVAFAWLRRSSDSIGRTVAFSDGTTMTLRDKTFGTEHRYLAGTLRERLISFLPAKLRARLSQAKGRFNVVNPSIVLWMERRGNGPVNGDPQLVLIDESGFGTCGGYSMMRMGMPGNWIEGWAFDYFPRRAKTFTLRIFEPDARYPGAKSVGEFKISNPKPGAYARWSAPLPPITARQDDLAVTLVDLTCGTGRGSNKWKPAANPTVSMTRAGFRVERSGRASEEWKPQSVEASDATGNVIKGIWGTGRERGLEYAELQPCLWPAEGAWKLRVGFTQRSNFVASEMWTLRVPLSNAWVAGAFETNLQGASLKYTGRTRRNSLGGDHHIGFRVTPARPDYRMTLVKAVDEDGGQAKEVGSFESPVECVFALESTTNATVLEVTVALHRTRYFDFLARPQVISPK